MEVELKKTTANKEGGLTCADRTRVIGMLEQANSHLDPASSLTLQHTTDI